jgi:hypothetical protein
MTARSKQPESMIMWAMIDPQGNIMDSTVMEKKKDAIYNGVVWGRCGDNRTLKDFEKEGYKIVKVLVSRIPSSRPATPIVEMISKGFALELCMDAKKDEREKVLPFLDELISPSVSDARKREIVESLRQRKEQQLYHKEWGDIEP